MRCWRRVGVTCGLLLLILGCGEPRWISSSYQPSASCNLNAHFDPKDPKWRESLGGLGFAWGCLVMRWNDQGEDVQAQPVQLEKDGKLFGFQASSGQFVASPVFSPSATRTNTRRFWLYVFPPASLDQDDPERMNKHRARCDAMAASSYNCFAEDEAARCWFLMRFQFDVDGATAPSCEIIDTGATTRDICEGLPDFQKPCTAGEGDCIGTGKWVCAPDKKSLVCDAKVPTPKTEELCNGKDDNCNGQVDEAIADRDCYDGPAGSEKRGSCKRGTQSCQTGTWSPCQGQVTPQTEICNNLDDNCDGQIDDGLMRECYTGPDGTKNLGECKAGTQPCRAGEWGDCQGMVAPSVELCNGKDDDCNGQIDDNVTARECYKADPVTKDVGLCKAGTETCVSGQWSACQGEIAPTAEVCNGKDDDCDGLIDEDLPALPCYSGPAATKGVSPCKEGMTICTNGKEICDKEIVPIKEICGDGIDDDCNGLIDDSCGPQLYEIKQSIDGLTGKVDGSVPPYWEPSTKTFTFPNLRIPKGATVVASVSGFLRINVTGPVEILGTLQLSGEDGQDVNCSTTGFGTSGSGRASGLPGGIGAYCDTGSLMQPDATSGAGANGTGGKFGASQGKQGSSMVVVVAGGGGGGGNQTAGTTGAGTDGGAAGAKAPTATVYLGAGGGGGGCAAGFQGAVNPFTGHFVPGAGGGGGGGVLLLDAVGSVTISGSILADGGKGGSSATCTSLVYQITTTGGAGGGGSGGHIQVTSASQIILANSATISAKGGIGGGPALSKGGDGGDGLIILRDSDANIPLNGATVTPAFTP